MTNRTHSSTRTPSDADRQASYARAVAEMVESSVQTTPPTHTYALLDVGAQQPLQHLASRIDLPNVVLFDGTPQAAFAQYSPRLIEVPTAVKGHARDTASELLVAQAASHACVSWLQSELSLDALATHLRRWLDGMLMDDDGTELGEVLLRFFDARVLPGFMDMLTPEQYGEFMRPIPVWGAWLRSGRWQTWARPHVNPSRFPPRIQRYSIAQQQRLDIATRVDRIQARLRDVARKEPDGVDARAFQDRLFALPHDVAFQHLDRIIERAARLGLHSDSDLLLFSALALKVSPAFDEHQAVRECILAAVDKGRPLAHAFGNVPDDVWHALASRPRQPAGVSTLSS